MLIRIFNEAAAFIEALSPNGKLVNGWVYLKDKRSVTLLSKYALPVTPVAKLRIHAKMLYI